jgi:hypothetical protein
VGSRTRDNSPRKAQKRPRRRDRPKRRCKECQRDRPATAFWKRPNVGICTECIHLMWEAWRLEVLSNRDDGST